MRSSLGLSIAVALSLGGCIAEPRVQSAAVPSPTVEPPAPVAPAVKPPAVTTAVTTPPTTPPSVAAPAVAASVAPAPVVAAPPASALCGGGSSADEARCRRVIAQDMARVEAAETARLRAVMKEVGIRQARLDDPSRPVRCTESAVDGRLVTSCAPSVLRP